MGGSSTDPKLSIQEQIRALQACRNTAEEAGNAVLAMEYNDMIMMLLMQQKDEPGALTP